MTKNIDILNGIVRKIYGETGLSIEEISKELGYNEGYISQVRSRNHVPDKFLMALRTKYKDLLDTQNEKQEDIAIGGSNESEKATDYNSNPGGYAKRNFSANKKPVPDKMVLVDLGAAIIETQAMSGIILSTLAELLAAQQGKTVTDVLEGLQEAVRKRTDSLLHGPKKT